MESRVEDPLARSEGEGFQRAGVGVEEPEVGDAVGGVEGALLADVEAAGRGREDLAETVRGEGDEGGVGEAGHPVEPPAGEVGHEDVGMRLGAEVKLGFDHEAPAAGPEPPWNGR